MNRIFIAILFMTLVGCTSTTKKTYFYPDTTRLDSSLETKYEVNRVVETSTMFETNVHGKKQLTSKYICYRYWFRDTYCDVIQ